MPIVFPDIDRIKRVSKDEIPALIGQLEDLKSRLWLRLMEPERTESPQSNQQKYRLECSRCGYRIREGEEQPRTSFGPLLTCKEVAKVVDMSESWIKKEIREGRLKAKRFGSHVRIQEDDLKEYIKNREAAGTSND